MLVLVLVVAEATWDQLLRGVGVSFSLLMCAHHEAQAADLSSAPCLEHVVTAQDAMAAAAEQDAAAAADARQRADQLLAEAEVAAAERMLEAAELEFNSARQQQAILQQALGQVSIPQHSTALCSGHGSGLAYMG